MLKKWLKGPPYGWKKALLIIVFSTCLVSGGTTAAYLFAVYARAYNASATLCCVVQSAPSYAPLPTAYLAEVLELSLDQPTLFGEFDLKKGEERLRQTHIVRDVVLKKIKPNCLLIDYTVRLPCAYVGNYTNTALDAEGVLFPYLPFYPPLVLPTVYVAHPPDNPWGEQIEPKQRALLADLISRFGRGELEQIDLSTYEAPTAGKRQLVLTLRGGTLLRLTPKNYVQELNHYFILAKQMREKVSVIDLRNPYVGYITHG